MVGRITALVFILLFLGAMFGGLLHMTMGMDMAGNMTGCPFMSNGEVLCSMNTLDHISAWQSAFAAVAPSFALLLLALGAVAIVLAVAPNLLLRQRYQIRQLPRDVRERIYTFSYRPLQELFSSGILHPKLF